MELTTLEASRVEEHDRQEPNGGGGGGNANGGDAGEGSRNAVEDLEKPASRPGRNREGMTWRWKEEGLGREEEEGGEEERGGRLRESLRSLGAGRGSIGDGDGDGDGDGVLFGLAGGAGGSGWALTSSLGRQRVAHVNLRSAGGSRSTLGETSRCSC